MGLGQIFLTWVESGQVFVARVMSAIFDLGLALENFPLKSQIFQFFAFQVKKNLIGSGQEVPRSNPGQPLIYCRSKVCFGQVGSGSGPSTKFFI